MNLYLRKDGRYESRIPNGKRNDGKRVFYMFLHAQRNSASNVFRLSISRTNHRDIAP